MLSDTKVLLHSINSNTFAASSREYGTTPGEDRGTRPTEGKNCLCNSTLWHYKYSELWKINPYEQQNFPVRRWTTRWWRERWRGKGDNLRS